MDKTKYSKEWSMIRMKILVRDKFKCQHCNRKHLSWYSETQIVNPYSPSQLTKQCFLQVAHLNQNKDDNTLANLLSLCPSCHRQYDSCYVKLRRISGVK